VNRLALVSLLVLFGLGVAYGRILVGMVRDRAGWPPIIWLGAAALLVLYAMAVVAQLRLVLS
jgi:predicted MFS family arabinose efflux permease